MDNSYNVWAVAGPGHQVHRVGERVRRAQHDDLPAAVAEADRLVGFERDGEPVWLWAFVRDGDMPPADGFEVHMAAHASLAADIPWRDEQEPDAVVLTAASDGAPIADCQGCGTAEGFEQNTVGRAAAAAWVDRHNAGDHSHAQMLELAR